MKEKSEKLLITALEQLTDALEDVWAKQRDSAFHTIVSIAGEALADKGMSAESEIARLKKALGYVKDCGHNDDCLFCARKDTVALEALAEKEGE